MSKAMKKYAENRIENLRKTLNGLADGAKEECQAAIDELNTLIADMEAEETEYTTKEVLDAAMKKIEEKLAALQENKETEVETENKLKMEKNYLQSENALHDFFTAMKESKNGAAFEAAWGAKLSENGITFNNGVELPEAVRGAILDAYERVSWLSKLKNTNAKRYMTRTVTTDQDEAAARAKGHKTGTTKQEEAITIGGKIIDAQYIYKLMVVDNITEWNDDGSLLRYLNEEMAAQWVREVERAVLVGDGRSSSANDKIKSVESVLRSATDAYVTIATRTAGTALIEQVVALREEIISENVVAFMTRKTFNGLSKHIYATGGTPRYESKETIASQIGVNEIIITNVMGNNADIIMMDLKGYATVGSIAPRFASQEDIKTNQMVYRLEIPFGGAVEAPKSAAVLKPIAG